MSIHGLELCHKTKASARQVRELLRETRHEVPGPGRLSAITSKENSAFLRDCITSKVVSM